MFLYSRIVAMERRVVLYSILGGIIKNGKVIRSACRKGKYTRHKPGMVILTLGAVQQIYT
jgi:hypothetical protein